MPRNRTMARETIPSTPRRVLVASERAAAPLVRALTRAGFTSRHVPLEQTLDAADETTDAVILIGARPTVREVARRLKTRFQMPFLPVVALGRRPREGAAPTAPDVWLPAGARPVEIVQRVAELVRIRRAERELVRMNRALAELAAEHGRLYDRARRDAEALRLLLRELQHRVRNNLAAIQAMLVLERHRTPPRPLVEALDVAIARLRSMAALQDTIRPNAPTVELAQLATAVARSTLDVFGATASVHLEVRGEAVLPRRSASAVAIVLNELVTNALKHSGAQTLELEIAQPNGAVDLVVRDHGCGIPDPSADDGSGLRIVRAVVQNELEGTLTVHPANPGTEVRITFPLPQPESGVSVIA